MPHRQDQLEDRRPRRRLPGLGALRTFEAAARRLSFTRAAEELGVTPAAVSSQVRALEDQIGAALFERTSRAVRLTRAGATLQAAVAEALDLVAEAVRRIEGEAGGRNSLAVTVSASFAAKWLVPRLDRFRRLAPEADLRIDVSDRLVDLAREGIDVGIRFGTGDYPGLVAQWLFAEEVFPVCRPDLLTGARALRRPDDLRHQTLLHVDWQGVPGREGVRGEPWPDWRSWLLAAGVPGVDAARGVRFSHTMSAVQAALAGQGVALGTTSLVADDLAAGRLVRPFDLALKGPPRLAYHLVAPRGSADRPLVRAFRDWVLAETRAASVADPRLAAGPASCC